MNKRTFVKLDFFIIGISFGIVLVIIYILLKGG